MKKILPIILGVILVIYSTIDFYFTATDEGFLVSKKDYLIILGYIISAACGIAIVVLYRYGMLYTVGFYALALGLNRTLSSLTLVFAIDDYQFIYGLIYFGFGLNMTYMGFVYLSGMSIRRVSTMLCVGMMMLLEVVVVVMILHFSIALGESIIDTLPSLYKPMLQISIYLLYILVLDSQEVRENSDFAIMERDLGAISSSFHIDSTSVISEKDAQTLFDMFTKYDQWKKVEDGGPVEYETTVSFKNGKASSVLILQKWKGCDAIYATLGNAYRKTLIQSKKFKIDCVRLEASNVVESDNLALLNSSGFFVKLNIRHAEEYYGTN